MPRTLMLTATAAALTIATVALIASDTWWIKGPAMIAWFALLAVWLYALRSHTKEAA